MLSKTVATDNSDFCKTLMVIGFNEIGFEEGCLQGPNEKLKLEQPTFIFNALYTLFLFR